VGEVRLGKIHLRWCDDCNVPVLEQQRCSTCSSRTREVKITPPGDARPAFDFDIRNARAVIDSQFGPGTGILAIPEGRIVLLNKAPDIDRMDEVIVDGEVVGALRFDIVRGERFLPRPAAARAIAATMTRSWVRVDDSAADAIRTRSASTLAVGVTECDPSIVPGAEAIVIDRHGTPVSVGVTKMAASEMLAHKRGTAVKTRWLVEPAAETRAAKSSAWDSVLRANAEVIASREAEAKRFIRDTVEMSQLPVAVSYSGGKDSLATLLLVLDAGIRPKLMFVDTGIEFEETRRNVRATAEEFSLELLVESAGDAFWSNLSRFGPPAKDFRWCCKTCKLGPATRLIQKNFKGGVLSFIGQRAYESEQRARKGRTWHNPWTPNQLSASPIQKWSALHVWLYLFSKKAHYNPLYERGLERIGCFMCPATDLAELRRVREIAQGYARWQRYLEDYASRRRLGGSWVSHDLWRWKRIPKSVAIELGDEQTALATQDAGGREGTSINFSSTGGYSPCVEGLSLEGIFDRELPMDRVANLLNALGQVTVSPDGRIAETEGMTVFQEGPVMIKARTEPELRSKASRLREMVTRAAECVGCGICVGRCEKGALQLEGVAMILPEKCTHCGSCLGPCPVVKFMAEDMDI
jgi:phosphoadenosine phosphosulfate reductase